MSDKGANPLLEPRLTVDTNKEKIVRSLLIDKPNITRFEPPGILNQVKNFLPQMAAAESKLSEAVAAEGGDKFDVENVAGVENVIEMDIAVMKDEEELERSWTSDSEDDSSPSPSENSFTSDTDISSSSTCSSSSCDESSSNNKK